jgi:hypothetical protein
MALSNTWIQIEESYWTVSGSFLTNNAAQAPTGVIGYPQSFFYLDPLNFALDGYTKTSVAPTSLWTGLTYNASTTELFFVAANFTTATWASNGWSTSSVSAFARDIGNLVNNNFNNTTLNPGSYPFMNIVILYGSVSGTPYTVAFWYFGNQSNGNPFVYPPGSQTFTSSGSFTVPAGITSVNYSGCGGGGGGGSGGANSGTNLGGGGGGGAGTNSGSESVTPGASLSVTIGNGGNGGAGINGSGPGNAGNSGTSTSFNGNIVSSGGGGGGGSNFSGFSGGSFGSGAGGNGGVGVTGSGAGGTAGGNGGNGGGASTNGASGAGYGAGGGGGGSNNGSFPTPAGSNGASGFLTISWS